MPTFEASFRGFIISSYLVATKFKCNNKNNKTNIKKTFRQSQEVRFGVPSTRIDTCLNDRAVAVVFFKNPSQPLLSSRERAGSATILVSISNFRLDRSFSFRLQKIELSFSYETKSTMELSLLGHTDLKVFQF